MDELINAMSNEDLTALKDKYADNPSVATLIVGILEAREREAEQVKARVDFERGIARVFAKLPHPDDIHNVYASWRKVEVPIADAEAVEVEVTQPDGSKVMEMRQPMSMLEQWVVETNKGFQTKTTGVGSTTTTSKRAITVFKRNGIQLEEMGHFVSASKACEHLKLLIGGDSATRVLARDGYITEPYDGTDYKTS